MTPGAFVLEPFGGLPFPDGVRVTGTASRAGAVLCMEWRLDGPAGSVALPSGSARPERRDALWEETCFECFLAAAGRPGYREFNLSPAGHWNVYRFSSYRDGMVEEAAFGAFPFAVAAGPGWCEVSARIDATGLGCAAEPWRLAVATVVAEPGGHVSWWALAHPAPRPDFHHAGGFLLELGPDPVRG